MKNIFYFFIVTIGIVSCKTNADNCINSNFLQPKDNIYAVLDSFVQENNFDNYVYELYVNKQTPHDYILQIFCGPKSLTWQENDHNDYMPLNFTIVSGKRFNIFSGIERYFRRENDTIAISIDSDDKPLIGPECVTWIVKDSYDTISVYKGLTFLYYPFVGLPASFPHEIFDPPF